MKLSLRIGSSASISTAVVLLMTRSLVIAAAFGTLAAGIAFVTVKAKSSLNEAALVAAWPEVIDHLMSGIQSGLSLTESLAGLSTRGPELLRPAFTQFKATLYGSGDVGKAIQELRSKFSHHGSDQIFEALIKGECTLNASTSTVKWYKRLAEAEELYKSKNIKYNIGVLSDIDAMSIADCVPTGIDLELKTTSPNSTTLKLVQSI